jgi:RHS repeat-associated protein
VNITDRGYTGHEHLTPFGDDTNSGFCLINMNGRIYDPVLARFLSPDPYVQAPDYTQSFNRYAYGWNNPFKYTDPSGNSIIAAMLIGGGINLISQIIAGNVSDLGDAFTAFGIGALGGLAGAGVGQAVAGALHIGGFAAGALTGGAGGAAGGFVGGAGNAWFNGASFGSGLTAGLKAGAIGAIGGALVGGLARGITDASKGFNFWDGTRVDEFSLNSINYEKLANNYNSSEYANNNDEILKFKIEKDFGIKEGDFKIENITTKTGKGYGMNTRGEYVSLDTKDLVGGYVRSSSSGFSKMHISPRFANGDIVDFRAVVGHEIIHAYHRSFLPGVERIFTERVAYKYTYDVYMNNNRISSALSTMQTAILNKSGCFWGSYPVQYQIPKVFNFH